MGKHQGYRIVPREGVRGTTWTAFARRPGGYDQETFLSEDEATAWALDRLAQRIRGTAEPLGPRRADTGTLADLYLHSLDDRRRSPSHRANVAHTLGLLAKAVPDLVAPDAHRAMVTWLSSLRITRVGKHKRKREVTPSAGYRNRVMAEAQAFCRWLLRQEYLTVDPSRMLERATVRRPIKAQFSVAEARQLLAPCADHPRQRWVALMLLAGLRADEAAAVTWADIRDGAIHVRPHAGHRLKRGKDRIVPLQAALASVLGDPGAGAVAPLPGAHSTVQMGRHFRAFLRHCGLDAGERTPHSCRHTYGAMMIATGCPDILVKAYMGHESVATTADYAKAAPLHVEAVRGWGMGVLLPNKEPRA